MAALSSSSSQIKGDAPVFSYAAAASGRAAARTQSNASTSLDNTQSQSAASEASGTSSPSSNVSTVTAIPNGINKTRLTRMSQNPSSATVTSAGPAGTPSVETKGKLDVSRLEVLIPSSPSMESASTSTAQRDDDAVSTATSAPDATTTSSEPIANEKSAGKAKGKGKAAPPLPPKDLIPAPIPQVNPWKVRQQTTKVKPVVPLTNGVSSAKSELQSAPLTNGVSKGAMTISETKPTRTVTQEAEKSTVAVEKRDSARDRRKDSEKINGTSKDEGKAGKTGGKGQRGQAGPTGESSSHAEDALTPALPPSFTDTTSWPTPDIAIDEEKKAKKEQQEKEKERPVVDLPPKSKTAWTSVPVTPNIIFSTQVPTKSGGLRGRGGNRGGSGSGDKSGKSNPAANNGEKTGSTPADMFNGEGAERGRNGAASGDAKSSRGGPNKSKRPASTGDSHQPRRAQSPAQSFEKRKGDIAEFHPAGQASDKPHARNAPNKANTGTPSEKDEAKSSKPLDDAAFVGQGVVPQTSYPPRGHSKSNSMSWRNGAGSHQLPNGANQFNDATSTDPSYFNRDGGFQPSQPPNRERAASRGNHRGARGGNNGFNVTNGVHYSNGQQNQINQMGMHSPASPSYPYGMASPSFPVSPSMQQPMRGGGYNNNRNPSRNQLPQQMPQFSRFPAPLGYPQQQQHIMYGQGGPSPYYDFQGNNLMGPNQSPYGYTPEQHENLVAIGIQIDYYFSQDNLSRDIYMRTHMDGQGFVPLRLVATFKRLASLSSDLQVIRDGCRCASNIELRMLPSGDAKIRPLVNPEQWVLVVDQRVEEARNNGPVWQSFQGYNQGYDVQPGFQNPAVGYAPPVYGQHAPHNEMTPSAEEFVPSGRRLSGFDIEACEFVPSGAATTSIGTPVNGAEDQQPDKESKEESTFSDKKVDQLVLIIVKHADSSEVGNSNAASSVNGKLTSGQVHNGEQEAINSGEEVLNKERGFYPGSPRQSSSSTAPTQQEVNELGWYVDPQANANTKPVSSTYVYYPYVSFKNMTLDARRENGAANTRELGVLYRFYSHFLRHQFNDTMYQNFKSYAMEDYQEGAFTGLGYLIKLFEAKLRVPSVSQSIIDDFASVVAMCDDRYGVAKECLQAMLHGDSVPSTVKERLQVLSTVSA